MNSIYCYSSQSKVLSIEAMLYSYTYAHSFFSWSPEICIAEKRNNEWDIFYDKKSVEISQDLCCNIFYNYIDLAYETLNQQLGQLDELTNQYKKLDYLSSAECINYFKVYSEFLHHYSFSNEFCFKKIENEIINGLIHQFGDKQAYFLLSEDNGFQLSDSYRAELALEQLRRRYQCDGIVAKPDIDDFIDRYAYLLNKNNFKNTKEDICALIKNNYALSWILPTVRNPETKCLKELVEPSREDGEIQKIKKVRTLRLLMREAMMLLNYHFTILLNRTLENLYKEQLSDCERQRLIGSLTRDELFDLKKLDISCILCRNIQMEMYTNNVVYRFERDSNLGSIGQIHNTQEKMHGRVVYGTGMISGRVKKAHESNKEMKDTDGYIYVTKSLHPKDLITQRYMKAVIVDEGGILSHASIMAQELRIPCIMNTRNACRILSEGDYISMDLGAGRIEILGKEEGEERGYLKELGVDVQDRSLYGNKGVNLCQHINRYTVAHGYLLNSDAVEKIYKDYLNNVVIRLSDQDTKKIQDMFPVILRSSSIYEDNESFTAAGLLESVEAISLMQDVYNAVIKIFESSKGKALEIYSNMHGVTTQRAPAILIQKYYNFYIRGCLLISAENVIIEYQSLSGKLVDYTINDKYSELLLEHKNHIVSQVLNEFKELILNFNHKIIEFGIDNGQTYLLQIRNCGV